MKNKVKRIFLAVIAIVLTGNLFGQTGLQVQRYCGSQLDFSEMQKTDPRRYQRFMDYEDLLQNQLLNSRSIPSGIITIPVVVHVVYNTSAQNISDARINEQIQVLNEDYRRLNADKVNTPSAFASVAGDAQIEFKLAKIDPNGNATTGITRTSTSVTGFSQPSNNVKTTSTGGHDPWNTQRYLNIWVCDLLPVWDGLQWLSLLGYSTSPVDFSSNPNLDGVVINFNYFGKTGTSAPYNKGRTTTHEVGHWLDLRHIWGDSSSCSVDDGVSDTPIQSALTPSFHPNCPSFPRTDACSNTSPGVMFMNYMDYTDDGCMNLFTNGQIVRMRALFDDQNGIRRQVYEWSNVITNPPSISGPSLLCRSSDVFTVSNAPAGFTWGTSSNLNITGTGINTATIITSDIYYTSGSPGWVSINLNNVEYARKEVWIGYPDATIDGPSYVGSSGRFYAVYNPLSNPSLYWNVDVPWPYTYSLYSYGSYADIYFYDYTTYDVQLDACNNCGCMSTEHKYVDAYPYSPSPGPFITYPNPVNDILTVEIEQEAIDNAKALYQTRTGAPYAIEPVFEFRMYNELGSQVRYVTAKSGSVQFNISNLPNGLYYLHIYDGISDKPEKQIIRVKH